MPTVLFTTSSLFTTCIMKIPTEFYEFTGPIANTRLDTERVLI